MENILPPLEVFALDDNMERLTGSIPYKSLIWTRRYYEPGEFSMQVPADIYSADWAYIYCEHRPETGIVQKVAVTDDALMPGGRDTVTVSGFFTESWLNRYVFLVEETEQEEVQIPKPARVMKTKPEIYTTEDGKVVQKKFVGGKWGIYDPVAKSMTDIDPYDKTLTKVALPNGSGVSTLYGLDNLVTTGQLNYVNDPNNPGTILGVDKDGKTKTVGTYGLSVDGGVLFWENNSDVGDTSKLSYIPSVAKSYEDTYYRKVEKWEEETASLEKVMDPFGGVYAHYYRTIKGAYQLRTEINEVDKENDNVQLILAWAARLFGDSMVYDKPDFEGEKKILDPSLGRFGDLVYDELKTIGASIRCFYSFEENQTVLQVWKGLDRTQDQSGNPWAVFNDDWGSIYGYSASRDVSNYRNKCYILYDYDCPNSWAPDGKPATSWRWYRDTASSQTTWKQQYYIPYTSKRGYRTVRLADDREDAEIYLDKRSDKPEQDDVWSRDGADSADDLFTASTGSDLKLTDMKAQYTAFWDNLEAEGKKTLQNDYADESLFDTGTLDKRGYIKSWDLGDVVDFVISRLGIKETARITEIEEVYDTSGNDLKVTIGETRLDTRKD